MRVLGLVSLRPGAQTLSIEQGTLLLPIFFSCWKIYFPSMATISQHSIKKLQNGCALIKTICKFKIAIFPFHILIYQVKTDWKLLV